MHRIALHLHRKTLIPWLADFRDPWTNIDFYKELRLTSFADRIHHKMELEVLKEATRVTVIGPYMATDYKRLLNRQYRVITNGFDPDDTGHPIAVQPIGKFSIAHNRDNGSIAQSGFIMESFGNSFQQNCRDLKMISKYVLPEMLISLLSQASVNVDWKVV